ncbi:hypothetical protein F4778DRAFT_156330 [Xylariomycetidae sp. FL2044]|nr:hypothetical protein F4778DRAFT_156330 [Xylariomycetidae sp. FL2044]
MASPSDDTRSQNEAVLDRLLQTPFWEKDDSEKDLLSRECNLEFPFAPPGMPKVFDFPRRRVWISYLRRTTKAWSRHSIVKYPTHDPSRFWVESTTVADVTWGGPHVRKFECAHIELVVIQGGKVTLVRTWSDPLAYYRAAGINLPIFHFDGRWDVSVPSKQWEKPDAVPSTEEEATAARRELFDYFLRPNYADPEREGPKSKKRFTEDFRPSMPFNPKGMMREFNDQFLAACNDWMHRTLVSWEQQVIDFHEDKFLDPDLAIVEANGTHGLVKWDPSGATSGYCSDYIIMVKLRDFQIAECREYLDPVAKLLSAGLIVPCFPFFY